MATTKEQIEKALKQLTPHPLQHWHLNKDGTITAINTIGQKFILTVETIRLDDLLNAPATEVPTAQETKHAKPKRKP